MRIITTNVHERQNMSTIVNELLLNEILKIIHVILKSLATKRIYVLNIII